MILYCRQHSPKKVISVGKCSLPVSHEWDDGAGPVEHADTGIVEVAADPRLPTESAADYFARLETSYQSQFA